MAKHRALARGRNGKIETSSLSLFAWTLPAGQERREEPVGVDRYPIPVVKAVPASGMAFLRLAVWL